MTNSKSNLENVCETIDEAVEQVENDILSITTKWIPPPLYFDVHEWLRIIPWRDYHTELLQFPIETDVHLHGVPLRNNSIKKGAKTWQKEQKPLT